MKRKPTTLEDQINQANIAWDGVKNNMLNPNINISRIVIAM